MSNILREPLVLPEDILIVALADLPDEMREQIGEPDDAGETFALTRPMAREPSKLIDASAAGLIEQFRKPRTLVQAVLSYSLANNSDPERTLEDSLPLLTQLVGSGLLLPEGTAAVRPIAASYAAGAVAGAFRVVRSLQVLDDSETYQAREAAGGFVALKIGRPDSAETMRRRLAREAAALRRLGGAGAPRLVDEGTFDGRPFLAMEWISGSDAVAVADELRRADDRAGLARLFANVARAYAGIHECGVLHGDIHPGNLVVGRDGGVTLIDFGLAEIVGVADDPSLRGGVGFFMEPEHAQSILGRRRPAPPSAAGEQFAVGALLYLLATGQPYMDFTLRQDEMFAQIAAAKPLPFADRKVEPWAPVEDILCRTLSVEPEDRFADMAALAAAFERMAEPSPMPVAGTARAADALVRGMVEYLAIDGELFRTGLAEGPRCSVNFGASGIAYALRRLASRRDDPHLLAAADSWMAKAAAELDAERAFYVPAMDLTEQTVGALSIYHTRPGLHLVEAMIAGTAGEDALQARAIEDFAASLDAPCDERDLCLGRTGVVLGCTLLLESAFDADATLQLRLRHEAELRLSQLWGEADTFEPVAGGRQWPNLGVAHGWAGLLFATLRFAALTGAALPAAARDRLDQLRDAARPTGRGATWPWRQSPHDDYQMSMPGWCNGSAGIVHLACQAHEVLGGDALLEMGEAAAWNAWEGGEGPVDLCCGFAGRAYALLEMHRATGDMRWLDRARSLALRGVEAAPHLRSPDHPRHSLYKGELGLALLIADLDSPGNARMPMFGPES